MTKPTPDNTLYPGDSVCTKCGKKWSHAEQEPPCDCAEPFDGTTLTNDLHRQRLVHLVENIPWRGTETDREKAMFHWNAAIRACMHVLDTPHALRVKALLFPADDELADMESPTPQENEG